MLTLIQSNAYVSGMQDDLKLYGNELNYFTTYFKYGPQPSFNKSRLTWIIVLGIWSCSSRPAFLFPISALLYGFLRAR